MVAAALRAAPAPELECAIEEALAWCSRPRTRFIALDDPDYPRQVLETPDPPFYLFVRGDPELLLRPQLALLISREANSDGVRTARDFAQALCDRNLTLLWELESLTHFTSLRKLSIRNSLAVDSRGLRAEGEGIAGTLVSAQTPGQMRAERGHGGPNPLLAALCRAILVVQGGKSSPIWHTARLGAEWGRDILAIPGSIHSPLSKASHRLIKEGAKLVESSDDIFAELAGF